MSSLERLINRNPIKKKAKRATGGFFTNLKTLQQLTSPAEASKKHRDTSKNERAKRMFEEAIEEGVKEENQKNSGRGTNQ